jgi:AraC-like DNA-binding protein
VPGKHTPPLDENMLRQVEELAGYGLTMAQIAAVLGFSERTLHNKKTDELVAALQRGKAKAAAIVGKALFVRAKDGDVPAIRWWEMTREGRTERQQTEAKVEVVSDAETDARLARLMGDIIAKRAQDSSAEPDA